MRLAVLSALGVGLLAVLVLATFRVGRAAAGSESARPDEPGATGVGELVAGPSQVVPRVTAKLEIAAVVARGEMGLAEATTRFRNLQDGDAAEFLARQRHYYPAASDDELYARNVISYVRSLLAKRPAEQAKRLQQLEAELVAELPRADAGNQLAPLP